MNDKTKTTEEPKQQEVIFQCCVYCKRYNTKEFVDKDHYRPLTLFNVILKDGKRAKACQLHVGFYERGK